MDHAGASSTRQRALCHLSLYCIEAARGFSIRSRASAACRLQASPLSNLAASNSCPSIRESDRLNVRRGTRELEEELAGLRAADSAETQAERASLELDVTQLSGQVQTLLAR